MNEYHRKNLELDERNIAPSINDEPSSVLQDSKAEERRNRRKGNTNLTLNVAVNYGGRMERF